jgi:hypothetical protein
MLEEGTNKVQLIPKNLLLWFTMSWQNWHGLAVEIAKCQFLTGPWPIVEPSIDRLDQNWPRSHPWPTRRRGAVGAVAGNMQVKSLVCFSHMTLGRLKCFNLLHDPKS